MIHRIPEEEIISIPARKALECFENKWLPVPYLLRRLPEIIYDGPTAWALDVVHEERNAGSWKDGGHASRGVCF
ncbi:MAG: virulence factor SrfB [Butyricimonas faecihominis]